MRRLVAPAAVAALAVPLTCGCSPGAQQRFTPPDGPVATGRATGAPPSRTAAAAERPGGATERGVQTFDVGSAMRVVVEWPPSLEAQRTAMVRAFIDTYVAGWKAVVTHGRDLSYQRSVRDGGVFEAGAWVRGFLDDRLSARGVAKLYGLRVTSVTGRGAEVHACVDQSGVRVIRAATGRLAAKQPAWTRGRTSVWLQIAGVGQGDDGVWRVKAFQHVDYPSPAAKECAR